jgi:hypothetical protein
LSFSIAEFFPGSELDFFPVETARRKIYIKFFVIISQKTQKDLQHCYNVISIVHHSYLSPSSILKSYFKKEILSFILDLKLGIRNPSYKINFNGNLSPLKITKKEVR